ncbi:MAG TPA: DNA polymerase III subunit beta [Aggregatilineales bacterium]|nr:DNA polymerase III subunit beta [Aggregatilineales bacterium]
MRVSVLQENLAKGLSIVNRAVGSRPTLPVLANVMLATDEERLKLSATNLELAITAWIGAKVEDEGAITIPAKTFLDLVNTLPPERVDLELDVQTNTLTVRCGPTTTNIKGIEASQFPAVPEAEADTGLAVPAAGLAEMIEQVAFAAAREDNRPILTGVLVEFEKGVFTMAATDGYRLAVRTTTLEKTDSKALSLIIPARTLSELSRIIGPDDEFVYLSIPSTRGQVMFHFDNVDVVSQLIDGKFPPYEQVIPKTHTTTTQISTGELLRACKRSEIFARDTANTSRLRIVPGENNFALGQLVVASQSQEKGDNEGVLEASVSGPGHEISLNVRYLIDVLNVIQEEQVMLETQSASTPGVFKPAGREDFTYVVMPMSVTR